MRTIENIVSLVLCIIIAGGSAWMGYKVGYFIGYIKGKAGRLIPGEEEIKVPAPIGNPENVI